MSEKQMLAISINEEYGVRTLILRLPRLRKLNQAFDWQTNIIWLKRKYVTVTEIMQRGKDRTISDEFHLKQVSVKKICKEIKKED